jgi:hypothetical protein
VSTVVNGQGARVAPATVPALRFPPIGGPVSSSWREHALTRVAELETQMVLALGTAPGPDATRLAEAIRGHLDEAKEAAQRHWQPREWASGSSVERTMSNLDAAQADLLRLLPDDTLRGLMPSLLAHVRHHLCSGDPRRTSMEELATRAHDHALQPHERDVVINATRDASAAARGEIMRVRSFRNVLLLAAAMLTVAAVAVAVLGALRPAAFALCFNPGGKVVCPSNETLVDGTPADVDPVIDETASGWDVPLVATVGLVAAGVAAAAALRGIRGTSTPYSLPVALAVLKLPTGALTAVLGLLLMRGQFVPGLSALDTSAQILAWAVVFGYAQQVFTRLVDRQAHAVLDDVGGSLNKASTG